MMWARMRGGVPVRLMVSCAMPAAPVLCVAQQDPASRAARVAADAAASPLRAVRDLFDRLLRAWPAAAPGAAQAGSAAPAPATRPSAARPGVVRTLRAGVAPREPLRVALRAGAVLLPASR